jgi:hypothetical protein
MIVIRKIQEEKSTDFDELSMKITSYNFILIFNFFVAYHGTWTISVEESRFLKKSFAIHDSQETKVTAF